MASSQQTCSINIFNGLLNLSIKPSLENILRREFPKGLPLRNGIYLDWIQMILKMEPSSRILFFNDKEILKILAKELAPVDYSFILLLLKKKDIY